MHNYCRILYTKEEGNYFDCYKLVSG